MKLIPLLLALSVSSAVTAKTTTLLCETQVTAIAGVSRGGATKDANRSTWSVVVDSDQNGRVSNVTLDNASKEFAQNGDLLRFKSDFVKSLEIDTRNLQARITITGFDTAEQGICKVVSTTSAAAPVPVSTSTSFLSSTVSATDSAPKKLPSNDQKAVVLNEVQTTNTEGFKDYVSQVRGTLLAFGGLILVKGGNGASTDGFKSVGSVAVIEFPSRTKALQWYESADYQRILKNANASSTYRIFSVEE